MPPLPNAPHFLEMSQQCITNPAFANFTIRCADKEYKVNSQILGCHSDYFRKVFENDCKECAEARIELKEDDPDAVSQMMTYFGAMKYDEGSTLEMSEHIQVYRLADKCQVPDLRALAVKQFEAAAAKDHEDTSKILAAITMIYDHTTRSHVDIRAVAVEVWLCGDREPSTDAKRSELAINLSKIPEFAAELAVICGGAFGRSFVPGMKYDCSCGKSVYAATFSELVRKECSRYGDRTIVESPWRTLEGEISVKPCWKEMWLR